MRTRIVTAVPAGSAVAGLLMATAPTSLAAPAAGPTTHLAAPPESRPDGSRMYIHAGSGKCLSMGPGDGKGRAAGLATCNAGRDDQWWRNTNIEVGNNGSKYRNGLTGQCLDVKNKSKSNDAPVHLWDCQDGPNNSDKSDASQAWDGAILSNDSTTVRAELKNKRSGKCIDLPGTASPDGVALVQRDRNRAPGQTWETSFR